MLSLSLSLNIKECSGSFKAKNVEFKFKFEFKFKGVLWLFSRALALIFCTTEKCSYRAHRREKILESFSAPCFSTQNEHFSFVE
jgi:hypothetical protein